jgi:hypothetical protein
VWGLDGTGTQPAEDGTSNVINVAVLSSSSPSVTVTVGGTTAPLTLVDTFSPYGYFYQADFSGLTGDVVLTVNGASATGYGIRNYCESGLLNFNSFAFSVNS